MGDFYMMDYLYNKYADEANSDAATFIYADSAY